MDNLTSYYDLTQKKQDFIDSLPHLEPKTVNNTTYFKFTGYQAYNKNIKDMIPEGYEATGLVQFWQPIAYTTINIVRLKPKS